MLMTQNINTVMLLVQRREGNKRTKMRDYCSRERQCYHRKSDETL